MSSSRHTTQIRNALLNSLSEEEKLDLLVQVSDSVDGDYWAMSTREFEEMIVNILTLRKEREAEAFSDATRRGRFDD